MMNRLKNHPFSVEAFFESSIVLTFAVPKEQITDLLPDRLLPDCFEDTYAFIAIAFVKTKNLRPKGFPAFLGNDFTLVGYRVFVRYETSSGKSLRGLFILRSETDKKLMKVLGNIFTHYQYEQTDIKILTSEKNIEITSEKSGIKINAIDNEHAPLPQGSPFREWKEARRFAGPLPFTFSPLSKNEMLIIEGVRENWIPQPIEIRSFKVPFPPQLNTGEIKLANAFIIKNISYYWKKGIVDKWKM